MTGSPLRTRIGRGRVAHPTPPSGASLFDAGDEQVGDRLGVGVDVVWARVGRCAEECCFDGVGVDRADPGLVGGNPSASLRQIAGQTGVSPETVRSIRSAPADGRTQEPGRVLRRHEVKRDPRQSLRILARDPALRSTDAGRQLLRILSTLVALEQDLGGIVDCVPNHGLPLFRTLALANAELWRVLEGRAAARERHARVEVMPAVGAA